tara:strand:+ start:4095 stop:4778 length:684 start_codon:yes stop_codon:yes gene_type:complete
MTHIQLLLIVVPLSLYGCALTGSQTDAQERNQQTMFTLQNSSESPSFSLNSNRVSPNSLHKLPAPERNINFYVRGLMQDLISNLQSVNKTTPVAVTSFVMLDGNYQNTNLLGNQIAEGLIHEIHNFGIPVIDFKTLPAIKINEQGDFIFSRNPKNLTQDLPIRYVFGGTMVKHQGGYLVNARVVELNSKAVVASAQSFIPREVSHALINENRKQNKAKKSIKLVQGS